MNEKIELIKKYIQDADLYKSNRKRQKVYRRQFICWYLRNHFPNMTDEEICKFIGFDRSTVIYSVNQHEILKSDYVYLSHTAEIRELLEFEGIDKSSKVYCVNLACYVNALSDINARALGEMLLNRLNAELKVITSIVPVSNQQIIAERLDVPE